MNNFTSEFVINNFAANQREFLMKNDVQKEISKYAGVDISTRGIYIKPKADGSLIINNERPLYLHIIAPSKHNLSLAVKKIQMMLKNPNLNREDDYEEDDEMFIDKITVGIEIFPTIFRMKSKLLGQNNENVNYIKTQTGSIIQLKGKGSGFRENETGRESEEPLYILIKYRDAKSINETRRLVLNLIDTVQEDFLETYGKYYARPKKAEIIPVQNPEKRKEEKSRSSSKDKSVNNSIVTNIDKITIGLERIPPSFNLKNKIYGPNLSNVKHIEKTANALLLVEGKNYGTGSNTREPIESPYILVKYLNLELKETARRLILNLIETVQNDFVTQFGTHSIKPQKPEIIPFKELTNQNSEESSPFTTRRRSTSLDESSEITSVPPPPPPPMISKSSSSGRDKINSSTIKTTKPNKISPIPVTSERSPIKPIKFQVHSSVSSKGNKSNNILPVPNNSFELKTTSQVIPEEIHYSVPSVINKTPQVITEQIHSSVPSAINKTSQAMAKQIHYFAPSAMNKLDPISPVPVNSSKPVPVLVPKSNPSPIPLKNNELDSVSSIPVINSDYVPYKSAHSFLSASNVPYIPPGKRNQFLEPKNPPNAPVKKDFIIKPPILNLRDNSYTSPRPHSTVQPSTVTSLKAPDHRSPNAQYFKKRSKSPIDSSFTEHKKFCSVPQTNPIPVGGQISREHIVVTKPKPGNPRYLVPLLKAETTAQAITTQTLHNAKKFPISQQKDTKSYEKKEMKLENDLKKGSNAPCSSNKKDNEKYVIVIDSEEDEESYEDRPNKSDLKKNGETYSDLKTKDVSIQTDDKLWQWQIKNIECACGRFSHVLTGIRSVHVQTIDGGFRR